MEVEDHNFVFSSWLHSQADARHLAHIPKYVIIRELHTLIGLAILEHPEWFRVACSEQDSDQILGWTCIEGDVLHYVYVKRRVRGEGVAQALLHDVKNHATNIPCSHWSIHCEDRPNLAFKPSLFYDKRKDSQP